MQTKIIPPAWRHGAPNVIRRYSTDELATLLKVRPQTIRAGLCRAGHYQGLKPVKSQNRFLLWPADEADRLMHGEVAK